MPPHSAHNASPPPLNIDSLLLRLVGSVELFRHLDVEDLIILLQSASKATFDADEIVFEEGQDGQSMYVVVQGRFEVYRKVSGKHVHLADAVVGEHFGEIALLASRPRTASVRASEPAVALRFTKQAVFANPGPAAHLFRNMARLMAERLISANEEIILLRTSAATRPEAASAQEPAAGRNIRNA